MHLINEKRTKSVPKCQVVKKAFLLLYGIGEGEEKEGRVRLKTAIRGEIDM